jgi:hypothetical protein
MAMYLPRDFPTADPPPEPTDPHSSSTPIGEIRQAFAVRESRRLTELTARISIVILPTDYPSVTPRRLSLSLPQLLFCMWPRARYDLVGVEHP